jgi:hypothetical protein
MSPRLLPLLIVLTAAAASAAGPETTYKAPRTELGQPDLRGVWNFSSDVPLERPAAFADKTLFTREELERLKTGLEEALRTITTLIPVENVALAWLDHTAHLEDLRTSLIVFPDNGKLPPLVEGVRRNPGARELLAALAEQKGAPPEAFADLVASGRKDGPEDLSSAQRCLFGASVPLVPDMDGNYVQIFQNTNHVVLLTDETRRIVPLDGRPQVAEKLGGWSGESRGRWEGDTLVIETRHFNGRTRSFAGAGDSVDKVVTERLTRISKNALEYQATVRASKTFQNKIVLSFPMAKVGDRIYEAACHEGNYSMSNVLAGARKEEQDAMKAKP